MKRYKVRTWVKIAIIFIIGVLINILYIKLNTPKEDTNTTTQKAIKDARCYHWEEC